jgi:phosphoenolpyruvate carboxykinase (diphosphate)
MDLAAAVGISSTLAPIDTELSGIRQLARCLMESPISSEPGASCPSDRRIENFLNSHFSDLLGTNSLRLPASIGLSRHGIAREISFPANGDSFANEYVTSYRVRNGVLHNPRSDRRTTKGTFHVCEGGLPIAGDKKAIPRNVFVALYRNALTPPDDLHRAPYASNQSNPVKAFFSLLLRPIVSPAVPGVSVEKTMEVRFFAPGGLVSNLDFVESIFGNAGDPNVLENDAALDAEHWTGHTGCVILAPQLTRLTKKSVGLPDWENASARQRRDGMCWREPMELYNDGQAFKITCRDASGVIVTLIADNYYGYCKKEVKTQISYAANLFGNVEEEHSGGALTFPRYNLGMEFNAEDYRSNAQTLNEVVRDDPDTFEMQSDGHAFDKQCQSLVYVPHDARADIFRLQVWWMRAGRQHSIGLRPGTTYMTPCGYKFNLEKHPASGVWRLIGTVPEGLFCHKPCTVSGGGKSEISKGLGDYILNGPILVADFERDFDLVQQLIDRDYSDRWKAPRKPGCTNASRPLLSPMRSLDEVIKLFTPSDGYTPAYNAWLTSLPDHIFPLVFLIKRYVAPQDVPRWRTLFSVDSINGRAGHELKAFGRRLLASYLRVGLLSDKSWRTFKVRQDFMPAIKVQMEDDITASIVIPPAALFRTTDNGLSQKFAVNCEYRLFQRPDDAIHPGLDRQTEADIARPDNFLSNFEPLSTRQVQAMVDRITEFDEFTPPMRALLLAGAESGTVACSANPRLVDGKPSKNPRYLQIRPDIQNATVRYIQERGMRLALGLRQDQGLPIPVRAVLIGRRNNPPEREAGIRPLAVYSPIHYQELPEFFMDVICSLTGKSPSTTGAGSEGALTKGPFNALRTIIDLNAALVSYALTGLAGFSTAAGYVGPAKRVDHDISLLVPEIWSRMSAEEREPTFLIKNGYLEALHDFEHEGRQVLASRLGYRITSRFVRTILGRIFDHPDRVFDESYLRPESQDMAAFVDGIQNITEAQERVAQQAFEDGSIEDACPPLRALFSIMAEGTFEGMDVHHPEVRRLFTRGAIVGSEWYRRRLATKQLVDQKLMRQHVASLNAWLDANGTAESTMRKVIQQRREWATRQFDRVSTADYLESLHGTLGADPALFR